MGGKEKVATPAQDVKCSTSKPRPARTLDQIAAEKFLAEIRERKPADPSPDRNGWSLSEADEAYF